METEKNKKRLIGYGCISHSGIAKRDIENYDKQNTNVYKKTKKLLEKLGYPNSSIYIDVINSHYRKRPILSNLIDNLKKNDVLVLLSVTLLGDGEDIASNYDRIVASNLTDPSDHADIFIPDDNGVGVSKFSTVDINLNSRISDMNLVELIEELETIGKDEYKKLRGRSRKEITPDFITAYWLYEKFLIPATTAFEIAKMAENTFHLLSQDYEKTPEYLERLEVEEQKYNISKKPKRYGKIPKGFVSVIALVDKGVSLESACIQSGIQPINPIDYERYKLKYFGGRKALAKAMEY